MSHPPFILASSSPRRLELLQAIGIVPTQIVAPDIDETPKKQETPRELCVRLAREKLHVVCEKFPNSYVIAADTVVGVGKRILPKAEHDAEVRDCLQRMSGRRHHVYTGVALASPQQAPTERFSDSTVIFRRLLAGDIEDYVLSHEGIGKAGGYSVQGRAQGFIRFMSGSYSGIMGLPLFETSQMLRSRGWTFS